MFKLTLVLRKGGYHLKDDEKVKETISLYKFIIGSLLLVIIAVASGVINSMRINQLDLFFMVGVIILYVSLVALIFFIIKLIKTFKEF